MSTVPPVSDNGVSSMQPTGDDFKARRDGWYEHKGTWGEVVVGTVLADHNSRTRRWEVVATSHGTAPIPPMKTLWMRAREMTTGEEFTIEPRTKTARVIILTDSPADTSTGPYVGPTDTEAVWALVEGLGATLMASIDAATGEVTCPDYISDSHLPDDVERPVFRGLIEHMRIAHNWAEQADAEALDLAGAITLHAELHHLQNHPGGGFPHRHVPEDLTLITGKRS